MWYRLLFFRTLAQLYDLTIYFTDTPSSSVRSSAKPRSTFRRFSYVMPVSGRLRTGLTTMTRTSSTLQDTVSGITDELLGGCYPVCSDTLCKIPGTNECLNQDAALAYLSCFSETLLESTLRFLVRRSASPSISIPDNFRSSFLRVLLRTGPLFDFCINAIES